jgi:hypothetical protein
MPNLRDRITSLFSKLRGKTSPGNDGAELFRTEVNRDTPVVPEMEAICDQIGPPQPQDNDADVTANSQSGLTGGFALNTSN